MGPAGVARGIGVGGFCAAVLLLTSAMVVGCGDDGVIQSATLSSPGDGGGADGALGEGTSDSQPAGVQDVSPVPDSAGELADAEPIADELGPDGDGDTAEPGADAAADTADSGVDVAPLQCPGNPGCPCVQDGDCPASACLATADGLQCAAPCIADQPCAPGTACTTLPGADTATSDDDVAVCAPKFPTFCDPCELSAACTATASPKAACVGWGSAPGSEGWYCATPCKSDDQCPKGAVCASALEKGGESGAFCVPAGGTCSCSGSAKAKAATTTCSSQITLPGGVTATCAGVRACSAAGLSSCGAATPKPEVCDGVDNDCNGKTDDGATCTDNNPCTADSCAGGACVYLAAAASCDDDNACSQQDACLGGACAGAPVECSDGNPCTTDLCDKKAGCMHSFADGAGCDDGNPCTGGDTCSGGACKPTQLDICPCTADLDCAAKEDGNLCNGTLYCAKTKAPFVCTLNPATIVVCDPKNDSQCAVNACDIKTGKCAMAPNGEGQACDDATVCSVGETCTKGACLGSAVSCDDGNACTVDSCDAKKGCSHLPADGPCSDGDKCTTGDTCKLGACTAVATTCDDGFACTADACDASTGLCQNNLLADPGCGTVAIPWVSDLGCEATAAMAQWQRSDWALSPLDVRWAFDQTPALPGAAGCSLNINNGKDLACLAGKASVDAAALSPWVDATAVPLGKPLAVRFDSAGSWTAQHAAFVSARIAGGEWIELGQAPTPTSGDWKAVQLPIPAMAGKKLQVRLRFVGPCMAGQVGWFVDNVAIFADACAAGGACPANSVCATNAQAKVECSACPAGYKVSGTGCVDVDECASVGTCDVNGLCTNLPGTYACACKLGYAGDGKTCTDIDECAKGTADCVSPATCLNKPGTFECICPSGQIPVGKGCAKKGSAANAAAASCLEVLTLYPGSPDGPYWLDVDGPGGVAPAQYTCDMKNGGWTLLIFDDFESGSASGWSAGSVQKCGDFGKILGGPDQFGSGAATSKSVAAPVHTQAKLSLVYIRTDSWDKETGVVQLNGNNVWTKQGSGAFNAFANQCGAILWSDETWDVSWSGAHTAATATLAATSTLNENAGNESFGIDNVALWVK